MRCKWFCVSVAVLSMLSLRLAAQTAHFTASISPIGNGILAPYGVALDASGNVFVADNGNHAIKEILAAGGYTTVNTIVTGSYSPAGIAVDQSRNVFFTDLHDNSVKEILASGGYATVNTIATGFSSPAGVVVDTGENLFVADAGNGRVVELLASNSYSNPVTLGFNGRANFLYPTSIALDSNGNVFVADFDGNSIDEIPVSNNYMSVTPIGNGSAPWGVAVDRNGNIFFTERNTGTLKEITVSSNYALINVVAGGFNSPFGVGVDGSGDLFVSDSGNNTVKELSSAAGRFGPTSVGSSSPIPVSLLFTFDSAGTLGSPTVVTQGAAGLDFTDAGTGTCTAGAAFNAGDICFINVAFKPTVPGARYGAGELLDGSGNSLATGYVQGIGIGPELVFTPGIITTFAGNGSYVYNGDHILATNSGLNSPEAVASDAAGNLYIVDNGHERIRKVTRDGVITTVAGNGFNGYNGDNIAATSATLLNPFDVALDGVGNIYIADLGNQRVRKVTLGGLITTVAGNGTPGYNGDDIAATSAELNDPERVAVDGGGNLYIGDTHNHRIRKVTLDGMITTVAGNGTPGYNGDNIGATIADLNYPIGVALDGVGNLYITDFGNNRIRMVTPDGMITTVAGNGIAGYNGDNIPAPTGELNNPVGAAVDASGNLYIADSNNNRVRKVDVSDPPSLTFPSTNVGSTSAAQDVAVENLGNAPLNFVLPFVVSPNFNDTLGNCPTELLPAATCELVVTFSPTTAGTPLTGTLTLTDDAFNSPQSVVLSGIGQATTVATTTTVSASPAAPVNGQPVTLTATISWTQSAASSPGGTVTFNDGAAQLGTSSLTQINGTTAQASLSNLQLAASSHNIQATYSGDTNYLTSSGTLTLVVSAYGNAATIAALSGTPQSAVVQTAFASPLIARVTDSYGNPIPGVTVTFTASSSGASATLSSPTATTDSNGQASVSATANAVMGTYNVTASIASTSANFVLTNQAIPSYVVTTATDDVSGTASNCTSSGPDCSLRDALAAAASAGAGIITFSSSTFSSPTTIQLSGGLTIPANTTITGRSTGSGATLTNLVTVSGGGPIFTVNSGVAAINSLIIANGGGAINNNGALTVNNITFSGNSAYLGGGINNNGTLTVANSAFSGNGSTYAGGAIYNTGTTTVTNSTFSGNVSGHGGAIFTNGGSLTVTNTTFSGNLGTSYAGGIFANATVMVKNTILANNPGGNCYNNGGTVSSAGHNLSSDGSCNFSQGGDLNNIPIGLAPLGIYGGPTQTMLPLPGSAAICAGSASNIPSGVTTDQRGYPNTNTSYTGYSSNTPCVDAGSVQTNYQSIQFTNAGSGYSGTVNQPISPAPVVSVTENGQNIGGVPVTLGFSGTGTATGLGPVTTVGGSGATFNALSVNTAGNDSLSATVPVVGAFSLAAAANLNIAQAQTPTTTSLTSSPNPAVAGQSVTFAATVTGNSPTGSVSFYDSTTFLGTVSLIAGQATYGTSSLAVGTHAITAAYSGDNANVASTSATLNEGIVAPVIQVSLSATSIAFGSVALGHSSAAQSVSPSPSWSAVGDFNNDGKPDIAVAVNDQVYVLINNGNGTFTEGPHYQVGSYTRSLTVGDFNGDGKLDIVSVAYSGGTLSTLLGNGNGTFTQLRDFTIGGYGLSIAAADFNRDGKLDVFISSGNGTETICLGNGDGTFQGPTIFNGPVSFALAVADVNKDGLLDIVAPNIYGSRSPIVWLNQGNGSVQMVSLPQAPSDTWSVAVGDFNGDGKPDAAFAGYGANDVNVYLGVGGRNVQRTGVCIHRRITQHQPVSRRLEWRRQGGSVGERTELWRL